MQVYQQIATDKYGATFANTELTQCFDVFLTLEQFKEQYDDKVIGAYEFGSNKNYRTSINADVFVAVRNNFHSTEGAVIRFIRIQQLAEDAVAGLADGAKIWPFDQAVDGSYSGNLISFNRYFKDKGVQYSAAKGGFVKSMLVSDKKLPVSVVTTTKRAFINSCTKHLASKAPGVWLSVDVGALAQIEAGCSLMKQLGYKLSDLNISYGTWVDGQHQDVCYSGLNAVAKYLIAKEELTTAHEKELIKTIKDWWSDL